MLPLISELKKTLIFDFGKHNAGNESGKYKIFRSVVK
jgi:hypothetical protein